MLPLLKYNGIIIANNVEYAKTMISQVLGLMFRKSIEQDYAKIFVFKKPSAVDIHMLFVFFPLDVIFLDAGKNVSGCARLNPWTGYKSMKNIKYIIEMQAGTIEKYNLTSGEKMEFQES